ncbi:MAG: hypothetical protein HYZ29_17075 [Myxococcales bacterium]|nr:hypothetical protein [Myxococcales bacterium]
MPKTFVEAARPVLAAVALSFAVVAGAGVAHAGDKALAETLFQEGRKLFDAGKLDAACAKFDASQRQDPSPGTLINLGKCNEARGKTATAWANYKEAESLARNMSRTEQESAAAARATAIEPLLSRLEIKAPAQAIEGLAVKRNGVAISTDALGTASPVDPGEHEIEASAPGYKTWTSKVTVGKQKDSASVQIPDLEKGAEAAPAVAPPPPATGGEPPPSKGAAGASATADAGSGGSSTKTFGYVLTGVGAVALIAGGYFGYAASKQASDAKNDDTLCPDKQCTPAGRDEIDAAEGKALISTIGVGVGVAALGTGIVLLVTAPSNKEVATSKRRALSAVRVAPFVDQKNAGLFVSGGF